MRYIILFLLLHMIGLLQGQDSYVPNGLNFHSTYERYLYNKKNPYQTDDFLAHYLATSPEINKEAVNYIEKQLEGLFQYLDDRNIQKKSPKRAAKVINEHLHKTFLLVEKGWTGFEDVFKKKTYNNITAAALYVLILEHFQMPYSMMQKPEGIYISLHKKKKATLLFQPDKRQKTNLPSFKDRYLTLLQELNIVPADNYGQKQTDSLFLHYYMPGERPVSPVQITGNLYFIQAMRSFKAKDYSTTIDLLYKSQMFLPLPRNQVMKQATLYQLAGAIDIRKTADIKYLFSLYKVFPIPEIKQEVLFSFRQIADYFLNKKGDKIKYQSLFTQYRTTVKDDRVLRNKLEKIYFSELAAYYAKLGETGIVLQYMDSLYTRWPENEEINRVIANKFIKSISQYKDYDYGIKQIEYQMSRYPFLRNNETVQDCHLMYYSRKGRDYFENGEVYKGSNTLETFEMLARQYKRTPHLDLWVKTIYIPASYYYFTDRSYEEARRLIKRALVFFPEDPYLTHRLELLENY